MSWGNPKIADWREVGILAPSFHFVGKYDAHIQYEYGDMVEMDGSIYVFDGSRNWNEIGPADNRHETTEEEIFFQCRSCGAPTLHNGVCPYCGTINRKVKRYVR